MIRNSLRLRLIAGGAVTIIVALAIAGVALVYLFERHVIRTVAADLEVHLNQLLTGINVNADNKVVVTTPPTDPRFNNPLSGLYWQISNDRGALLRSRSLWDSVLSLPTENHSSPGVSYHELPGPTDARVLVAERPITLTIAGKRVVLRVAVATNLTRVVAARASFAGDLAIALGLLGIVLAAATAVQVGIGLRPLDVLRKGVADIRSGQTTHLTDEVPDEVRPLVEEVNALLDAREQDIVRSRNRAADLAHGLKTPLAVLAADGDRLREKGDTAIADEIEAVIDAMRRHVDRELARARLRSGAHPRLDVITRIAPLVRSLIAALSRTARGARLDYVVTIADDISAPLDRTDVAEVMGNLLENATRHAKSRVRVAATVSPQRMTISFEDDGPGIAEELQQAALARGVRLDERAEGTGLGLAIVQDVLDAYGWTLILDRSDLGGLKVVCSGMPPTVVSDNSEEWG